MSDFLRPEVRAAMWRWREPLVAALFAAIGLWWGLTALGPLRWLGWALAALSVAAGLAALRAVRFRRGGGGLGVVEVDEARVTYFGPLGGGSADLGDLERLDLDRDSRPAHWWLTGPGGPPLAIPVDAEGADGLFEAFTALPGLPSGRLVEALQKTGGGRETVWRRPRILPAPRH
ncbi:hypothetical protein [Wenxinia marina]|uniref:Uncharacterized protein n=1 Tax=Wenxinia marina DSM 24838 TaxID=1123501 RepID=A0A0D0QH26_9RHOB|nr:hypothetical protein [Wenxinia marina]KIQ70358.1 hypothetical protein Wenmar_00734 [Wenxinia marina DSM 24838]GGL53757.1 hypothetical protein GCM10011392_05190 [Wenxinia marina]